MTGSIAFGALARLVLVTAKGEDGGRILARAKSNIGPDGGGFGYTLEQVNADDMEASRVAWGAPLEGSARELLGAAEQTADSDDVHGHDEARDFLGELLRYGARPAKQIFSEAQGAGFSRDQMHRAKRKIGAVAVKKGMDLGWSWELPEGSAVAAKVAEGGGLSESPSSLPSAEEPPSSDDLDRAA